MLFAICNCVTTLHPCYIKNALIFSHLDVHYFFMDSIIVDSKIQCKGSKEKLKLQETLNVWLFNRFVKKMNIT